MDVGTAARTVASTNMNKVSSRAHTIFKIQLTQSQLFRDTGKATDKVAVINLIDLAGSERAESTGATGDRLKEGCAINQVCRVCRRRLLLVTAVVCCCYLRILLPTTHPRESRMFIVPLASVVLGGGGGCIEQCSYMCRLLR